MAMQKGPNPKNVNTFHTSEYEMSTQQEMNTNWCDIELTEIAWLNDGRDLLFRWQCPNNIRRTLTCFWASAIKIDLISADNELGYPFTWYAEIRQSSTGEWKILFDFASKGDISLQCNELLLEEINSGHE